jgi:peptidoglycan/LPS O-acetylase OafA/YrhL
LTSLQAFHTTDSKHHRFHFLDALRGLAAILVVLWHAPANLYSRAGHSNFMAVDFFFCLSGFVVSFSYEHRLEAGFRFRDFAAARLIRLYPTYLIAAVLGVALYLVLSLHQGKLPVDGNIFSWVVLTQLLLLPDYFFRITVFLFPFDYPAWSLFFELLSNFIYGLMVKLKSHRVPYLLAIAIASLLPLLSSRNSTEFFYIGSTNNPHLFFLGLCRVMLSFVLGVLTLRLFRNEKWLVLPVKHRPITALIIAMTLTLLLQSPLGFLHTDIMRLIDIVLLFPCIVYVGAHTKVPESWTSTCALLGELSFPIYLLHVHAATVIQILFGLPFLRTHQWAKGVTLLTAIGVFVFACIALLRYYELPVRNKLRKFYNQHMLAPAPIASKPVSISSD